MCSVMLNVQFWRMAVLWTIALMFSYLKLFCQIMSSQKSKCYPRFPRKDSIFAFAPVQKPVCVITGAGSGLGAAAAYDLSKEGFYVVLVGRSSELLSKTISDIKNRNSDACLKAFEVDLSSFKSILKFKHSLQQWLRDLDMHFSVQLLINNAGILATSCRITSEGYDEMLATNYIGAFCLTKVLLPLLENSTVPSRVVNVTSFTHWNGKIWLAITLSFMMSVSCDLICHANSVFHSLLLSFPFSFFFLLLQFVVGSLIEKPSPESSLRNQNAIHMRIFMSILNAGLMEKSQHLTVVAVDPGAVKTNIMREIPSPISNMAFVALKLLGLLQPPETGVCSVVDAALASPEVSGVQFFGGKGRTLNSSRLSYDAKLAKSLWDTSCDLFQELQLASRLDE